MTRAVAAVLAVALLAGCGSATDGRRKDVNRYIASVDRVERGALASWNRARRAYVDLGRGAITPRELRELSAAPGTIRSLRTQIAAVTPPADAKRLHASLLRLLVLDESFAEEVAAFGGYVRAVGPLEREIGTETAQLRRALGRNHAAAREERALTAYAAKLDALDARFRRLRAPAALAPWDAEQRARIAALGRGARDLATGLARHDRALARRGLTALTAAASASPVTLADRTAILSYNARLARIRAAAAAVAREQGRLAKELA